jgi:hypothetical protein
MATPSCYTSKGKDEQDNPIYFTGDLRDWQLFKQELQSLADRKDYRETEAQAYAQEQTGRFMTDAEV